MGIVRLAKCLKMLNSLIEYKDRKTDIQNKIHGNRVYMDFISIVYKIQLNVINELNYVLFSFLLLDADLLNTNLQKLLNYVIKFKEIIPQSDIIITLLQKSDVKSIKNIVNSTYIELFKNTADGFINHYVYISIVDYIVDLLTNKLTDVEYILIAFDGIPSFGKIQEQRQRRYMKIAFLEFQKNMHIINIPDDKKSLMYIRHIYDNNNFQIDIRNAITYVYNKYHSFDLQQDISKQLFTIKKDSDIGSITVAVIDKPYGEGEKILMDKLINDYAEYKDTKTYVFYSPDGDSVILCLNVYIKLKIKSLNVVKIFNQEPTKTHNESSQYVDIQTLYNNIIKLVEKLSQNNVETEEDKDNICSDFILLMNLYGNDFIHQIPTMEINSTFMDLMFIYVEFIKKYDYLTTIQNNVVNINYAYLIRFFEHMSDYEHMLMLDTYINNVDDRQKIIRTFGNLFSFKYLIDYREKVIQIKTDIYNQIIRNKITHIQIKNIIQEEIIKLNQITTITNKKYGDIWLKTEIHDINTYALDVHNTPTLLLSKSPKFIYYNKEKKQRTKKEIIDAINVIENNLLTNNEPIDLQKNAESINKTTHDFLYDYTNIRSLIPHEQMPTTENDINLYMLEWRIGNWKHILNAFSYEIGYDNYKNKSKNLDHEMKRYQYDILCLNDTQTTKMVIDYLKTLSWMMDYYMNTDHNSTSQFISTWSFNYSRSPFITHIHKYLKNIKPSQLKYIMKNVYKKSLVSTDTYIKTDKHKFYIYPQPTRVIKMIPIKYISSFPDIYEQTKKACAQFRQLEQHGRTTIRNNFFDCALCPYFSKCIFKSTYMTWGALMKFKQPII